MLFCWPGRKHISIFARQAELARVDFSYGSEASRCCWELILAEGWFMWPADVGCMCMRAGIHRPTCWAWQYPAYMQKH